MLFRRPAGGDTKRSLLVTGCGRSGTTYIARLLQAGGLRIEHEAMRQDGTVSWFFAVDSGSMPPWGDSGGKPINAYRFEHIVHQVRQPLQAIGSSQTLQPASWDFAAQFIPLKAGDTPLLRGMKYWLHWNLLAQKKAHYTYRVEALGDVQGFDAFCRAIGRPKLAARHEKLMAAAPTTENTRRGGYTALAWDDLRAEDAALTADIEALARSYGY